MFDIAFSELVVLSLVGLFVLGPKRWPPTASKLGEWLGSARRTAVRFNSRLARETLLDEIARRPKPNLRLVPRGDRHSS